ncbi:MAG: FGGY-family carbohydrate kinase [bacterium]
MKRKTGKYILAIDLGTSGPKVALVSTEGKIVDHEVEKTGLLVFEDGGVEQNPDDWWNAIIRATRQLLKRGLVSKQDIAAISCTTQWSGTVAVDRRGQPLMNAISWMDSRGAPEVQRICKGIVNIEGYGLLKLKRWLRLTGGVPGLSGKDPVGHILFIKNKLPNVYEQTYKFLEPKDYINLRLTGQFAASYDSIILHWVTDNRDISRIAYDRRLLKMASLEREKLPDLKQATDILGPLKLEIAEELGLNKDIPVIVGTPDIQSAAIGSGAVRDYQAHLYIGTSSWLSCHVPFKKADLLHKIATLPSAIPGRYFVANEQQTAGSSLNFLRQWLLNDWKQTKAQTNGQSDFEILDHLAESVTAGSNKVIFSPWLNGERCPVENQTLRGGFYNLALNTRQAHLIRAVYEGVAYNSRWLLQYVEKFVKRQFDQIHMIGGGANSDVWCQIHADVLNRPIRQMTDPVLANARGAGLLASVALGYLTFDDIAAYVEIHKTYDPNPKSQATYDELFSEFVNIYKNNKKMYARLNRVRARN